MTIENITVSVRGVARSTTFEHRGNTWYLGGMRADSLEELRRIGLDEESVTMLVLKYGTPRFPYRAHMASPYTPRNIRKDLAKTMRLTPRLPRYPYHA